MTYTLTMGKSHRWAANEERKAGVSEVGTLSGLNTWGNLISTEPTWIRHVTSVQRVCSICGTTSASCCTWGWHPWYQCCVEHVRQTYSTEPTWLRNVTSVRSVTRGFHIRYTVLRSRNYFFRLRLQPRLRTNCIRYLDNYLLWLEYRYFFTWLMHVVGTQIGLKLWYFTKTSLATMIFFYKISESLR